MALATRARRQDMTVFTAAGVAFALGALLLLAFDRRILWALGALLRWTTQPSTATPVFVDD